MDPTVTPLPSPPPPPLHPGTREPVGPEEVCLGFLSIPNANGDTRALVEKLVGDDPRFAAAVRDLGDMGLEVLMLTGDSAASARHVAGLLGLAAVELTIMGATVGIAVVLSSTAFG